MSTNLLSPKMIKRVASALYEMHYSSREHDTPPALQLTNALYQLFNEAVAVDPEQKKHPQQRLFYALWKGNQRAVDNMVESGIMSPEAREGMRGDLDGYKANAKKQLDSLEVRTPLKLSDTSDGMAVLAGAVNIVYYNMDDALPEGIHQAMHNVSAALKAYAISLDPHYPKAPLSGEPNLIMQDLLSVANNGEQMYDAQHAVKSFVMDKFLTNATYLSGNYRELYGSDAVANIVHSAASGLTTIMVPTEGVSTDMVMPTLTEFSGLDIRLQSDIPTPDEATRTRVAAVLHAVNEKLSTATFADYNGDIIDDPNVEVSIRERFNAGVAALDDATISKYKGYDMAISWSMADEPELEQSADMSR